MCTVHRVEVLGAMWGNYPGGRGPRIAQVKYTPQVAREAPPHPKRTFAVALLWGKLPGGKLEALEEVATP